VLKKILVGLVMLGLAGALIASASTVGQNGVTAAPGAPTIALVNEDEPASFNGTGYAFGKEFVGLVSNDNRYNWQVVSRGVAEKAYSDEAVSAVIVLPRSFSHDLLTLQDIDPTEAVIDYRVTPGDALSEQRLQNELFTILRDFNTRVVKMYFASVAGNIAGAQVGMETVVGRYSKLVGTLADDVQPQLAKTGEGYARSESMAQILRSMNSAWIQAQNGFTSTTTGALTSISGSLAAQQPKISDYFSLQEQIAQTNLLNGNAAIDGQATSDKDYYSQAFAEHIGVLRSGDGTWSGLDGLTAEDADGKPTGALAALRKTVSEYDQLATRYNASVAEIVQSLSKQEGKLATSSTELAALAKTLLNEYFGIALPDGSGEVGLPDGTADIDGSNYTQVDLSTVAAERARAALAQKVATSFAVGSSTPDVIGGYEAQVKALVAGISTDPAMYTALFDTLESAPGFSRAQYESQLALIKGYVDANGIASPALTALHTSPAATEQTVTKKLPVTVPAGAKQRVEIQLPSTVKPSDVTVSVASPSRSEPGSDRIAVDAATGATTIDNTESQDPLTVVLDYAIDLHDLAGDTLVEYTARDADTSPAPGAATPEVRSLGSDRYVLMPANAAADTIAANFSATSSYLAEIATAANLLRFLYAAPGESEATFSAAVLPDGDFREHSTQSVYSRYGAVDAATIADHLSTTDVDAYRRLGVDNITAVLTQLGTVEKARAAIQGDIDRLGGMSLTSTYFTDALQQLESWYAAAITSVSAAPELWSQKSNAVVQLTTTAWDGQKPGRSELYLDEKTGPTLYASLTQLVETSSRNAEAIATSAHLIDDNSAQFEELVSGVQRTQAETNTLLGTMNGTIAADRAGAAESSTFSSRFSTVLANTRASGADPAKIYETFANPVTVKDTTPAAKANRSDAFDYRWIAVFAAGGLIGALIAAFARRHRPGKAPRAGA